MSSKYQPINLADGLTTTDPQFIPVARELAGEYNKVLQETLTTGTKIGVSIQANLPAPAMCLPELNELVFDRKYWVGIDADKIGDPALYEGHAQVIGHGWHELGHLLFSANNFDRWAKSLPAGDIRRTAILFEESRVERLFLTMIHYKAVPEEIVITAVLRESLYFTVLLDFDVDSSAPGWKKLSELMLFFYARVRAKSAIESHPKVKEVLDVVRPMFTEDQWRRAQVLIDTMHVRMQPQDALLYYISHLHRKMIHKSVSGKRFNDNGAMCIQEWIDLMKEVAGPEPDQPDDDQGDQGGQDGQGDQQGDQGDQQGDQGDQQGDQGDQQGDQGELHCDQGGQQGDQGDQQGEPSGEPGGSPEKPDVSGDTPEAAGGGGGDEPLTPDQIKKLDDLVDKIKDESDKEGGQPDFRRNKSEVKKALQGEAKRITARAEEFRATRDTTKNFWL